MKSGTLAITNIKTEKEHDDKPEVASCTDARETYWDIVSKRIKELGITRRDVCRTYAVMLSVEKPDDVETGDYDY